MGKIGQLQFLTRLAEKIWSTAKPLAAKKLQIKKAVRQPDHLHEIPSEMPVRTEFGAFCGGDSQYLAADAPREAGKRLKRVLRARRGDPAERRTETLVFTKQNAFPSRSPAEIVRFPGGLEVSLTNPRFVSDLVCHAFLFSHAASQSVEPYNKAAAKGFPFCRSLVFSGSYVNPPVHGQALREPSPRAYPAHRQECVPQARPLPNSGQKCFHPAIRAESSGQRFPH